MKTAAAVKHFGSITKLAQALHIKPPSICKWGPRVPPLRQIQLERITAGKLRAEARYRV